MQHAALLRYSLYTTTLTGSTMYGYTALQHTTLMCVVHSAHHTDLLGSVLSIPWDCIPGHVLTSRAMALLPETQH